MTNSRRRVRTALRVHLGAVCMFLYLPILVLVALSFNRAGLPTAWTGFSVRWYGKLWENGEILSAAVNTLIVASCSTVFAAVMGGLLALGAARRRSASMDALLFAPMIIPDIVLAVALLSFYSLLGIALGLHTVIMSHIVFNIAFVCAVVRARLTGFDLSIVEASADLGAGVFATFWRITLPVIFPGVLAGALLAFTLSVDEFIIAFFTAGPGGDSTTLPMRIYSMMRFGVTPEINAMASLVMLASFILLYLSQRLHRGNFL